MGTRPRLGSAFSDSLISGSKSANALYRIRKKSQWWQGTGRILLLSILLWVGLFVLVARLFQLTVIDGHRYRVFADENRTRELIRHAPRGKILDRAGIPLVNNIPQYRLLSPCTDNSEQLCISRLTGEEGDSLQEKGLSPKHFLEVEYRREYTYPEETAHVVGYTGEVSDTELQDEYYKLRKYLRGDRIGRTGSEMVFEEKLRGRDGRELVEVDANGKILRVLGRDPELPGENITLTIDAELSKAIKEAFPKGKKGAVIVTKPQTGEILALFSSPTYSINDFSLGMTADKYSSLINDKDQPLFDRAIGGVYPAASTYKIVISAAGLESGTMTKDTRYEDTGVITIGPFKFPNWFFQQYGKTDGMLDVTKALARSNDIFFYKAGEELGISRIRDFSTQMGVGKLTGIELPGEASGLLPGPEWKNQHFTSEQDLMNKQNEWYLGDTYHLSIGQGYLLSTPLQVNQWTNSIANGGYLCKPTILSSGNKKVCKDLNFKQTTIDLITEGMEKACAEGGTAYPLFDFGVSENNSTAAADLRKIPVACKTGTAEFGEKDNNTHAWITLFAPIPEKYVPQASRSEKTITGEPEVTVTVLVEGAGEGSAVAAPIAKKILEAWFSR